MIKKDWHDFKNMHGGIEGARAAFEKACETTFRKTYVGKNVQQVEVKQGDGGIDVFVGELSIEPVIIIQCKFFLNEIAASQKQQISKSFKKAIESKQFIIQEWILCVPRVLNLEEHIWWVNWVGKQALAFGISKEKIKLINGNELIDLMKKHKIYYDIFNIEESAQIIRTGQQVEALLSIVTAKQEEVNLGIVRSDSLINDVLFYNYKKQLDKYYLIRNHDYLFLNHLKTSHLWISGKSGSGKTVTVNRNLIIADIHYIFCDLSPTIIHSSDDVFKEVYFELAEYLNITAEAPTNILKQLTKMLLNINSNFVIVIDELSITSDSIFLDLTDKIVRLINYYSNKRGNDCLRFVISTINKPKTTEFNKSKAGEYFQFINVDDWVTDIKRLYDLIEQNLNLHLPEDSYKYIIENCSQSPRYLKNIIKKVCSLTELTEDQITHMTDKAKKEFI